MKVAVDAREQAARGQRADLVEARDHAVAHVAQAVEDGVAAREQSSRAPPSSYPPTRRASRRSSAPVLSVPGAARREREMHLRDHLAEPPRLREERGVLLIDHGATLDRVGGTDPSAFA